MKDVREVEILDVSMMGRWTTFVDKHGDGIKNPMGMRENLKVSINFGSNLWIISSDFESSNSLD